MKCFYHNDADGKCAGFWVHLNVGITDLDKYPELGEFIPIDYRVKFPLNSIRPDEQIYIVDYSIEPSEMRSLLEITEDVTWIDHHKTAIAKYDGFDRTLRGVRYDGIAGCMLTYCYIHHMTERGEGGIKPFDLSMINDAPMFTKLIADWDVWDFNYGEESKYFHLAFESYDFKPSSERWGKFFEIDDYWVKFVNEGKTIQKFVDQWAKEYAESFGFETEISGFPAYAINLGRCNSDYFKSIDNSKYRIWIPFVFDGEQYTVSLYASRDDVDVSDIAIGYGGGGHKSAAGFQCKELPFARMK